VIARNLALDLASAFPADRTGALLSFGPTLSEGMSPALRRVVERVEATLATAEREEQLTLWL
jgi:hypothetical protein